MNKTQWIDTNYYLKNQWSDLHPANVELKLEREKKKDMSEYLPRKMIFAANGT